PGSRLEQVSDSFREKESRRPIEGKPTLCRREAADAGGRRMHAEAGHDLLRGAQEPPAVRPPVGFTNLPLTTRHLVRRALATPVIPCPRPSDYAQCLPIFDVGAISS